MAENLLEVDPELKVLRFFKRHFGDEQPIFFDDQQMPWTAEAIGALVLKKLRFDAESFASSAVESAVITVPAHFSDPQRKAVLAAAMMADLPVLGLVEEPVAAALHYGVQHASHDQVILVYDWGGGTFDATAISLDSRGVYVLAKTGATDIGGKELDEAVAAMVLAQFEGAFGSGPSLNARTLLDLRRVAEEIKVELSSPNCHRLRRTVLLGGLAITVDVSRAAFNAAAASWIDRTEAIAVQCVADAGLKPSDMNAVLLVGGSSMVPAVAERLRRLFARRRPRPLPRTDQGGRLRCRHARQPVERRCRALPGAAGVPRRHRPRSRRQDDRSANRPRGHRHPDQAQHAAAGARVEDLFHHPPESAADDAGPRAVPRGG